MSSLKIKNISKKYGALNILKNIEMNIEDGEFLVLVGPSGCGKSTTLRIIAGLEEPSEGEVYIGGEIVNDRDPSRRDIAMVFQNYALYPHMTVYENMAFGLTLRKLDASDIKNRVQDAAEILMLTDYLERRPKELSGGQRQRVALGRAIVRQPQVFLFDEPLSNLDAKLRSEMRLEIKKLHQMLGTTMIYVTHDQTEAMTMGDRIAVMNNGIIEQLDTPRNLYDHPCNRFVASFIGSPEMNFIEGNIKVDNKIHFINDEISLLIPNDHSQIKSLKSDDSVVIGIRPEDMHDEFWSEIKNETATFKSEVELIENLGANIIAHCQIGNTRFTVNLSKSSNFKAGADLNIIVDMDKTHFFDIDNGNIL